MKRLADCRSCPRLVHNLKRLRTEQPDWHNGPVPSLGDPASPLLVLGLAPGRQGANRTGLPFVGDPSSAWLQARLRERNCLDENDQPIGIRISNAVKCLPPGNKPSTREIKLCGKQWLAPEVVNARVVLALGRIAHDAVLRVFGERLSAYHFAHAAEHQIGSLVMVDSFHPSPLNTSTGRLHPAQFDAALGRALKLCESTD